MPSTFDAELVARQIKAAQDESRQLAPLTAQHPGFDMQAAYEVAHLVHQARLADGETPMGRKLGFTNPAMWARYGVKEPVWAHLYGRTVTHLAAGQGQCSLRGFVDPKIEPEVVFHFSRSPAAGADSEALLDCIDAVAMGFEIVQSRYPGWVFEAPDAVADWALHAHLFIGPSRRPQDLGGDAVRALGSFTAALSCGQEVRETGQGSNVLGHPLAAVAHLTAVLSRQPQYPALQAGEWLTTGTITSAHPVQPGQTWRTRLEGLDLPDLCLTLTD